MTNKPTYTEVLEMINEKFDKLDTKLDKMDSKLDGIDIRVTVVETEAKANKSWVIWVWGASITVINIAINLMAR